MNEIMNSKSNTEKSLAIESLLIDGDLSKLSPEQRVIYYKKTCESLGLNFLTKPFAYLRLNGKLTLYALKDCTEQLRKRDGVSIVEMRNQLLDGVYVVTAFAETKDGKKDVATGAVTITGLKGEALANAYMKAETKAKRRVTLSVCGLGMTDEGEIEAIPGAQKINVNIDTGEIDEVANHEYAQAIKSAKNLDELKMSFLSACKTYSKSPDLIKEISELKDKRKQELESEAEVIEGEVA